MEPRTGANHPMYGKVPANSFPPTPPTHCAWVGRGGGPNNPMFGKYGITPANAMAINVYSLAFFLHLPPPPSHSKKGGEGG